MTDAAWGLQMTGLGMGLVFGLLSLLWGLLTLVQRFERSAAPAADAVPAGRDGRGGAVVDEAPGDDAAVDKAGAGNAGAGDGGAQAPRSTAGDAAAQAAPPVFDGIVDGLDDATVAAIVAAVLAHRALLRREAAPAMRRYQPGSLLYASRWLGAGRARQNSSWHGHGRGGR